MRCPNCANVQDIEIHGDWAVCLYCGSKFDPRAGEAFSRVPEDEAKKIGKMRKAMRDALSAAQYTACANTANDILQMIPGDFLASFYQRLAGKCAGGDPRAYEDLLIKLPSDALISEAERNEAANLAIDKLKLRAQERGAVENFIDRFFISENKRELTHKYRKKVEDL